MLIKLTAEEWELYSGMAGVNGAAYEINSTLSKLIENSLERMKEGADATKEAVGIRNHMYSCGTLEDWDQYGFGDTEPEQHLIEQINKHLNTNIDRFMPIPPFSEELTKSDMLSIVYDLANKSALLPNCNESHKEEYKRQQKSLQYLLEMIIEERKTNA